MKRYSASLMALALGLSAGFSHASGTIPVGFVNITCPSNSDTIVGLPMRQSVDFVGTISAAPDTTTPGSAILTLSGSPGLTVNDFANSHYVKFKTNNPAGPGDGQWFGITANTAGTLTVDLNDGAIGALSGASLEVIKFWTLGELFPPADCTSDPLTTGTAIVASTGLLPTQRRTEILLPNLVSQGINLGTDGTYYVHGGIWKKQGEGATPFDSLQLWPDIFFIIRHPAAVTSSTTYTVTGEVEINNFLVPLSTRTSGKQDNYVAMPRPVDVTLDQLNLGGTAAFVTTTSPLPTLRRDELIVFNNAAQARNKSAAETYFYYNSAWRKQSNTTVNAGSDVIPAGAGFLIRKYQTAGGETVFWNNTPSY